MKSYESSTATLRAILAHPSLQREKVDETMDAMASAQADAKEIDDAIRMGADMAQSEAGVDDAELEAELAALVREAKEEQENTQAEERQKQLSAEELKAPVNQPSPPSIQQTERNKVAGHA